ncbi:MAG: UDP-glucose 4-epimerase GalE [bacterium]|nr:UDP-glucose 4-epimerase GalE [bacterium]
MKILVTGGAGYIGSHMVRLLIENGYGVVVFDNLKGGHRESLPKDCHLVIGDLFDSALLEKTFSEEKIESVMHFAGVISMEESVRDPHKYFRTNVFGAVNLFEAMVKTGVKKLIFSSTAGVYGNPSRLPIPEDEPCSPTNPYGESKLMVEKILKWYDGAYGLKSVALRYFNAAGASLDGSTGEDHWPETHLIPLAIKAAQEGRNFYIFGDDYPTRDGTCVRDYIHVLDLCESHLLALEILENGRSDVFNIGTGEGRTNREVVEAVKKITGIDFKVEIGLRRPGDAIELVASPEKIKRVLGWQPKYSDLETIVKTAWQWHRNHPKGFQP